MHSCRSAVRSVAVLNVLLDINKPLNTVSAN